MRTAFIEAQSGDGWAPQDWIAFAGAVVAVIGIAAGLFGVWLGAQLSQISFERQRANQGVDLGLVRAEIALDAVRISNLQTALMSFNVTYLEAQLRRLQKWEDVWATREAMTSIRVTHPVSQVRDSAAALDASVLWVYEYTLRWFELRINELKNDPQANEERLKEAFEHANQAQEAADQHWHALKQAAESSSPARTRLRRLLQRV